MTVPVRRVLLFAARAVVVVVAALVFLGVVRWSLNMTAEQIGDLLAFLVVWVALPLCWLATGLLWRLSRRRRRLAVLRERAIAMTALALLVTVFAAVFINNDMEIPPLDLATTRIMTRGALLLLAVVPAVYWLIIYRSDR